MPLPKALFLSISCGAIALLPLQSLWAQTPSTPLSAEASLELNQSQPSVTTDERPASTSNSVSEPGLTIPSLWWAQEQFGGELLDDWLTYPTDGTTAGRIDLLVNRQNWNLLDYLERYQFVNKFGTVARDYRYNLRVLNEQKELLATYTCNFNTTPNQCNIQVEATAKARVRGAS